MSIEHDLGEGVQLAVSVSGHRAGPVLAVLGGVHGDELEGILAARLLINELAARPEEELRGQVRVVAVSNPAAHAVRTRTSPIDGANLARVFPGRLDGTITERIAQVITDQVIAGADLLVDLHSAGANYVMPVFAGYVSGGATGERSADAARAFGAPLVWEHHSTGPGRSLGAAAALGVPSLYVEGSGGGGLLGADLDVYVGGLRRLVSWLGITGDSYDSPVNPILLRGGDGDVDASYSCSVDGYCITRVEVGVAVATGTLLAEILADDGSLREQVRSNSPGTVMMLRRRAEIVAGDAIAMLGPIPEGR